MSKAGSRGQHHGRNPPTRRPQLGEGGVTLVELVFAITILAILIAIAAPSFRDASLGSRLSSAANDLLSAIQVARSEAIKTNTVVTVCTSTDGSTCADAGDWNQGWVVLDRDANVIQSHAALSTGLKMTESGGALELSFQPIGVGASPASFTVCRDEPIGSQERVVTVTGTGLAYVTRTETGACP